MSGASFIPTRFDRLDDVPQSYTGHAGKTVRVKSDETGLEFVTTSEGTVPANYYVSPGGNDSNSGLSSGAPLKTLQAVINKIPPNWTGDTTLHIASGTYAEAVEIINYRPSGDYLITFKGYINPTLGQFTDSPALSGTSSGGNTNNYPDNTSLFKDTTARFGAANTQKSRWLKITGGTGFVASPAERNWYVIDTNTDASTLQIVGRWSSTTPDNTTTYEIYDPTNAPTVDGEDIRTDAMLVAHCTGIRLTKLRFIRGRDSGLRVVNSNLDHRPDLHDASINHPGDISLIDAQNNTAGANAEGISVEYSTFGVIREVICRNNTYQGLLVQFSKGQAVYRSLFRDQTIDAGFLLARNSYVKVLRECQADGNTGLCGFDIESTSGCFWVDKLKATGNMYGLAMASTSSIGLGGNPSVFDNNSMDGIIIMRCSDIAVIGTPSDIKCRNNGRYGIKAYELSVVENGSSFTCTGNGTAPTNATTGAIIT